MPLQGNHLPETTPYWYPDSKLSVLSIPTANTSVDNCVERLYTASAMMT